MSALIHEQKRILANHSDTSWPWQHAAVQPTAGNTHVQGDHGSQETASSFGYDFSRVTTQSTPCPATPRRCPFGGACHTCPVRIQPKLKSSQPADEYERAADHIAEMVMRIPEPKNSTGESPRLPGRPQAVQHQAKEAAKSASDPEIKNSFRDVEDDPMHRTLIEQFRQREHLPPGGRDETGALVGPSEAEIKYGGLLMPCPSSTEVANTIDLRNEALAAGFRTAYGIHAQMRVRPDGRTWDGIQISESLTTGTNSCPDTLTRGQPCSGGSSFTVGAASGNSPVLAGPRPGARNRFWDFHTTHVRPRGLSILHDATRNPANLNTCSTVCNQEYRCNGNLIGSHTITRTYRKGTYNGQNITFVDVTKR